MSDYKDPYEERQQFLERPLPSSTESERVVLGAIILENSLIDSAAEILKPEDFYSLAHRRIFKAMLDISKVNDFKIDPILIGEELKKNDTVESVGGLSTITNLTFGLPHFSNISNYAQIIKDKARIRNLIKVCNEVVSDALAEEDLSEVLFEKAESKIFALADTGQDTGFIHVNDLADAAIANAQEVAHSGNQIIGLTTGFVDIDGITLGLQKTDLDIVAARPSMGKTAFGMGMAQNSAFRDGKTVAVFSIEMSKEQLTNRVICSEAMVDGQKFRAGLLSADAWGRVSQARSMFNQGNLLINDLPDITTQLMRQKLRRLIKKVGHIDWILVDYLQLMTGDVPKDRQQEVAKISRELKLMGKDFDTTIVALAQLNRGPESRKDHRPNLGDLRESGAIEQNADLVAFLFREEMYPKDGGLITGQGTAEFIVAKQRNGPTGTVMLSYDKAATKFSNYIDQF